MVRQQEKDKGTTQKALFLSQKKTIVLYSKCTCGPSSWCNNKREPRVEHPGVRAITLLKSYDFSLKRKFTISLSKETLAITLLKTHDFSLKRDGIRNPLLLRMEYV